VCDLETSRMGAPYIYIYIYDISRLRVNLKIRVTHKIKINTLSTTPQHRGMELQGQAHLISSLTK